VDVGSVRIGVAVCDREGLLATPVETVRRGPGDLERLRAIATEHEVVEIVVGLPVSMSGEEGVAAATARSFAGELAVVVGPLSVRMVDERLSTVGAHRALVDAGMTGRKRRDVVDQAAAVIILQNALDAERTTARPPGVVVGLKGDG
jgi:putative Holliday junction resolvase